MISILSERNPDQWHALENSADQILASQELLFIVKSSLARKIDKGITCTFNL